MADLNSFANIIAADGMKNYIIGKSFVQENIADQNISQKAMYQVGLDGTMEDEPDGAGQKAMKIPSGFKAVLRAVQYLPNLEKQSDGTMTRGHVSAGLGQYIPQGDADGLNRVYVYSGADAFLTRYYYDLEYPYIIMSGTTQPNNGFIMRVPTPLQDEHVNDIQEIPWIDEGKFPVSIFRNVNFQPTAYDFYMRIYWLFELVPKAS